MRRAVAIIVVLLHAAAADARRVHGQVYADTNRDGRPSAGEPGVAGAIVAFDVLQWATADRGGQFDLDLPDDATGIAWVRVPDGYDPGPVWARVDATTTEIDLGVRPSPPRTGPATFVVAADTHLVGTQPFSHDLRAVATAATALDPPPAFFTILGDITQGNQDAEFDLVDASLADLGVPYVPVPGNHDWYDGGQTWFRRYGPDNYSFDLAGTHFVVWNMSRSASEIRTYLAAELRAVDPAMPIVALTHGPPAPEVVAVLHELGVDAVLTGHVHANHVTDHDGLVELGTEPLLMGGLDFSPAGYRVITLDGGRLVTAHHSVV
ncbi:MAG: metallophosphoesterase, partial [Proteobacteria bacterium]|nr:metallophosphoesterase [Pseudomonadota bacterium]